MSDSCWFVLTRVEFVLIRVDWCWFVLTRVDLCWHSCIRIDLIPNFYNSWVTWLLSSNFCHAFFSYLHCFFKSFILGSKKTLTLLFFYKQCCLTCSWIELQMLLRCKQYHIETFFIFTISRFRCIYVVPMWSIFRFYFHHGFNRIISWIQMTHLLLYLFFRICSVNLDDNVDEECE